MEKCNSIVRQREKVFGGSFHAQELLVALEPVKGNVDSLARVMSIRVRRLAANSGGTAVFTP